MNTCTETESVQAYLDFQTKTKKVRGHKGLEMLTSLIQLKSEINHVVGVKTHLCPMVNL